MAQINHLPSTPVDAVVIGAGPAGLAVAATLTQNKLNVLVLDRATSAGSSWLGHYDRLHLHTERALSGLPGYPIPRHYGRWVSRADLINYFDEYVKHYNLQLLLETEALHLIPPVRTGVSSEVSQRWTVQTNQGDIEANTVVVATGYNHSPFIPDWPGKQDFEGLLIHSSQYQRPFPYAGKIVLVVGAGNSGAEIAADLAENGAKEVWLSFRTPPNILRRQILGISSQFLGVMLRPIPPAISDPLAALAQKLSVGNLASYGLPRAPRGIYTQVKQDGQIPILDVGFIAALRARRIKVVPAVKSFSGTEVRLVDGTSLSPEVVVAATGYRRGLEKLVGPLGLLNDKGLPRVHSAQSDPSWPGLYFIGYSNPISGNLREISIDAKAIARAVIKE
jgi:putative flavoprotein involved in K+ transport